VTDSNLLLKLGFKRQRLHISDTIQFSVIQGESAGVWWTKFTGWGLQL